MEEFSLQGKSLKLTTEADIEPHLVPLKEHAATVKRIILSGNTIGIEAAQALAKIIPSCVNLEQVDFSDIFTGRLISEIPTALKSLADSLIGLKHLHTVDFSDNAFGGRSVEPLVAYIESSGPSLRVLKLSNNGMGPQGGSVIAQALARSASSSSVLESVICGRNRLENGSSEDWARAYKAHAHSLQEIRMYQNGIRMEGIQAIVLKGLSECSKMRIVDFQDNTATLPGSRAVANTLSRWPLLEELNLSDCLLRPKGSHLVASALAQGHNPQLVDLKLQSNELDNKAVEQLALAVKSSLKKLARVELNGNRCAEDDEPVEALKEALAANGFEDALDELDDVEEVDPDEEDEEEDEDEEELAEVEVGEEDEPAENVRVGESDLVKQDKVAEYQEPKQTTDDKTGDALANLLDKVTI